MNKEFKTQLKDMLKALAFPNVSFFLIFAIYVAFMTRTVSSLDLNPPYNLILLLYLFQISLTFFALSAISYVANLLGFRIERLEKAKKVKI